MTIKELKEQIKDIPDDYLVMTDGYEGGFKDCEKIEVHKMILGVHPESYYGNHEITEESDRYWQVGIRDEYKNNPTAMAVLL